MASKALLAVTTDFPLFSAVRIKSFAGSIPPITSITKSICGSLTIDFASLVKSAAGMPSRFNFESFTAIATNSKLAPALEAKSDLFAISSRAIWEPTTPAPSMPTLRVFIGEVSQTYEICRGG